MKVQSIGTDAFLQYGKVVEARDFAPLLDTLIRTSPKPADGVVYVPSDAGLEELPSAKRLEDNIYGGMPVQIGYCNGSNNALNCLEYHRGSEVNIAADDVVLLLAPLQKVCDGKLDTAEVEAFLIPAGTAVLLYETTLHYAPCNAPGSDGFRVAIVLLRGTNLEKPDITAKDGEDNLLWARNKWLIVHPDSPEAAGGAWIGLTGENIIVK